MGRLNIVRKIFGREHTDPAEEKAWVEVQSKLKDRSFYRRHFQPWRGYGEFGPIHEASKKHTIVTPPNCWILYSFALQTMKVRGDIAECGVYRGGTATLLSKTLAQHDPNGTKRLHLFDTFAGMPETNAEQDWVKKGEFSDTSEEAVRSRVVNPERVSFHKGLIPDTFKGQEALRFSLVHIDLDIYQAILDACEFMYPRLAPGGAMVFDDYCYYTCPGARAAVDEFFAAKPEFPIVLPNYQAVVVKL